MNSLALPACLSRRKCRRLFDRSFLAPFLDLRVRVAKVPHYLIRMLPQFWSKRPNRTRRFGKLHRNTNLLHLEPVRTVQLDDHLSRAHLGVRLDFIERIHLSDADVGFAQYLEPFIAGAGPEGP